MSTFTLAIDGASRGNPGAAGIGVVVYDQSGKVVREVSEYIGRTTNNVAEYTALIRGLEEALRLGAKTIRVQTDSELLARQMSGTYRVKSPHLLPLYERVRSLLARFQDARIAHVSREQNAQADKLAGEAARRAGQRDEDNPHNPPRGQKPNRQGQLSLGWEGDCSE
jgi:ribonuclease HI